MSRHKSLTNDVLLAAMEREMVSLDNPGFCTECGAEHFECEPDAENYPCEECGENKVSAPGVILGLI